MLPLCFGTIYAFNTFGAQAQPGDHAKLLNDAGALGVTRVLITLDDSVSLSNLKDNLPTVRAAMEQKAKILLAELGQEAMDVGYWNNGIGQIGAYLTANGLKILANSANAKSYMPDVTHHFRIRANDMDGSLDAVENAINTKGFANVEIVLNLDGEYDIDKSGVSIYRNAPTVSNDISTRLARIQAQAYARGFRNVDTTPTQAGKPGHSFRAHIDRKAFYALREDPDVRAIRLVGFQDRRTARLPPEALASAKTNGSADVILTLRGGSSYSPKSGHMSENAWKAQANAHRWVFEEILANAGTSIASSMTADHLALGSIQVKLSHAALAKLYSNPDLRLLGVSLNRPIAQASLLVSTELVNMQSAWNSGYRAAGQNIVVLDSGVRKTHAMFMKDGRSKVTYEACFGTNNGNYVSICPKQDAAGDSPLGLADSAIPANFPGCDTGDSFPCGHGTHVAGIAAGRSTPRVMPLQGVAPDASIIAAQIFSYDERNRRMTAFSADILRALNGVFDASAIFNPYVVNLSFATPELLTADCPNFDFDVTLAVRNLASRGIPVVVSTGNRRSRTGISWPACVPQVIKVSAIENDQSLLLSGMANIGNPNNYTGPILIAPGGGDATAIVSAGRGSDTETARMRGTSMAAPHVAGFYAALKSAVPGISVANATAWIVNTGSVP